MLLAEAEPRMPAEPEPDNVRAGVPMATTVAVDERDEHEAVDRTRQTRVEVHVVLVLLVRDLRVMLGDGEDGARVDVRDLLGLRVVEGRLVVEARPELHEPELLGDRSLLLGELILDRPDVGTGVRVGCALADCVRPRLVVIDRHFDLEGAELRAHRPFLLVWWGVEIRLRMIALNPQDFGMS